MLCWQLNLIGFDLTCLRHLLLFNVFKKITNVFHLKTLSK